MYSNILAAAFNRYAKYSNEEPYFRSVAFLCFSHLLHFSLILAVLKQLYGLNILIHISLIEFIVAIAIWSVIIFIFYSKGKVDNIVSKFNSKSTFEKNVWGVIAVILFIVPIILLPILLSR